MDTENGRPKAPARTAATAVNNSRLPRDDDPYDAARLWVAWTARRRWPDYPANDDVWAVSVASWWGDGVVRRG
jgi:hypothetical protein